MSASSTITNLVPLISMASSTLAVRPPTDLFRDRSRSVTPACLEANSFTVFRVPSTDPSSETIILAAP